MREYFPLEKPGSPNLGASCLLDPSLNIEGVVYKEMLITYALEKGGFQGVVETDTLREKRCEGLQSA